MNEEKRATHRELLIGIAERAMAERGLVAGFPADAMAELSAVDPDGVARALGDSGLRDLRPLPWCSIDNDDSRDLDQLSVALSGDSTGPITVLVAIADVDFYVEKGSALDLRARHNTSTVYTAAKIFPLLPEPLSTGLSSLNQDEARVALVIAMTIEANGSVSASEPYRAVVLNRARLSYDAVAAWLDGRAPLPDAVEPISGLEDNLRLQDVAASRMKKARRERGSLEFGSRGSKTVLSGDFVTSFGSDEKNRAKEMIENFMVGANGVVARFLADRGFPSLCRVVREPRRWDRIVAIAKDKGFALSTAPDPRSLADFLARERTRAPEGFAELSLSVLKLLGPGEYVAYREGQASEGHFGLAVREYAHSTAPNRRYPDLVTHRLVKAALARAPEPYGYDELAELGRHCTLQEDEVNKVERQVGKSAAALLLSSRVGERFEAAVTGAADKGTWVRLLALPVEGRLSGGREGGLDVGDRLSVRLVSVDVERGYIDFERA